MFTAVRAGNAVTEDHSFFALVARKMSGIFQWQIFFTSYSVHSLAKKKFLGGNPSVTTSGDAYVSDVV